MLPSDPSSFFNILFTWTYRKLILRILNLWSMKLPWILWLRSKFGEKQRFQSEILKFLKCLRKNSYKITLKIKFNFCNKILKAYICFIISKRYFKLKLRFWSLFYCLDLLVWIQFLSFYQGFDLTFVQNDLLTKNLLNSWHWSPRIFLFCVNIL